MKENFNIIDYDAMGVLNFKLCVRMFIFLDLLCTLRKSFI